MTSKNFVCVACCKSGHDHPPVKIFYPLVTIYATYSFSYALSVLRHLCPLPEMPII